MIVIAARKKGPLPHPGMKLVVTPPDTPGLLRGVGTLVVSGTNAARRCRADQGRQGGCPNRIAFHLSARAIILAASIEGKALPPLGCARDAPFPGVTVESDPLHVRDGRIQPAPG
jgi:hypothetical protein